MPIEPLRYEPADAEVTDLMRCAVDHPLGIDYLRFGHLGTVAITFGYHAFTVVAAREKLARTSAGHERDR